MRKGIIIALILVILILLSSIDYKVDALSLDGQQTGITQVRSNAMFVDFWYDNHEDWFTFSPNYVNSGNNDFLVFPLNGYTGTFNYVDTDSTAEVYIIPSEIQLTYTILSTNGGYNRNCEKQNNFLVCPIVHGATYTGLGVIMTGDIDYLEDNDIRVNFSISQYPYLYKKDNGAVSAIENQTQQQQQQHNEIMNANQTYEDELDENINGTTEMQEYTNMEDQLFQNIDTNATGLDGISINPNASTFIWDIVNGLRNMNPSIITLITSILGLGIVKLVLNR